MQSCSVREWACAWHIDDTQENIAVIPDEVNNRQYDEQESCAVRAVFHAIWAAIFKASSLIIKDIRPQGTEVQSVHAPHHYENRDTIPGFVGVCLRLVYRKSDHETKVFIKKLQMAETMKRYYTECGVLAQGTSSHRTLPVRGINEYLKFLNKYIAGSCTNLCTNMERFCEGTLVPEIMVKLYFNHFTTMNHIFLLHIP